MRLHRPHHRLSSEALAGVRTQTCENTHLCEGKESTSKRVTCLRILEKSYFIPKDSTRIYNNPWGAGQENARISRRKVSFVVFYPALQLCGILGAQLLSNR